MTNEITIREYEPADEPAVLELLRLNTPRYFSPEEKKDMEYYLANELEQYFVVTFKNALIGCGGINFSDNGQTGKLSWDMLHPEYQGKGIGSLLVNYRLEKLRSLEHVKTISVRTSQHVYPFYEKLGFKLQEVKKDYWAAGFDLYSMVYKD